MIRIVLAITTFNRLSYLRSLISSFDKFKNSNYDFRLIIADDGSTDGTLEYLDELEEDNESLTIIKNKRKGVHYQFNTIIQALEKIEFDYCFKCDDDIEFIQLGWEDLYIRAIQNSGYHHLCFHDPTWRPEKNLKVPIETDDLIGYCEGKDVQGAFFTITPEMVKKVGYMDTENFGFRGVGHIDYTIRACRLGYNDLKHPFDAKNSHLYVRSQGGEYKTALPIELIEGMEDELESKRKYNLILENRSYIPFQPFDEILDEKKEQDFLKGSVRSLQRQKQWYEEEIQTLKQWEKKQYGHLPSWYVKLGKIFKIFS